MNRTRFVIALLLALFFLTVARLFHAPWLAAALVGLFVLFFAFFGLSLTSAAGEGEE